MYIVPLQRLKTAAQIKAEQNITETPKENLTVPFKDIFEGAINNVKETDAVKKQDTINLALGNADDLHNIMINMNKATMAINFAVEIRNKALDAYNEIMRMGI